MDPTEMLACFAILSTKKKDLKNELKVVEEEMSAYQEGLLTHFEKNGIQSIKQNGMTIYLKKQLWAGKEEGVTGAEAVEALKEAGLEDYIGPSTQGLSAYLRELDANGEGIPQVLQGKIKLTERFTISTRRG
tara:strand:+ start:1372 stop:1767 length:396 start_codon:yes stop_codon:yes gene_type:complete